MPIRPLLHCATPPHGFAQPLLIACTWRYKPCMPNCRRESVSSSIADLTLIGCQAVTTRRHSRRHSSHPRPSTSSSSSSLCLQIFTHLWTFSPRKTSLLCFPLTAELHAAGLSASLAVCLGRGNGSFSPLLAWIVRHVRSSFRLFLLDPPLFCRIRQSSCKRQRISLRHHPLPTYQLSRSLRTCPCQFEHHGPDQFDRWRWLVKASRPSSAAHSSACSRDIASCHAARRLGRRRRPLEQTQEQTAEPVKPLAVEYAHH